jgi:hypothetical protein
MLFDLHNLTESKLNSMLVSRYEPWNVRRRPGDPKLYYELTPDEREQRDKGVYDHKIYKGETVIFSDADMLGKGAALKKMIRDNKLGRVVSISTVNPNTLNKITTYLWVYNGNKIVPKKPRVKKETK